MLDPLVILSWLTDLSALANNVVSLGSWVWAHIPHP